MENRGRRRRNPHVPGRATENSIQTLIFPRPKYTPTSARAWAEKHGFYSSNARMDIKPNAIHIRQYNPEDFARIRSVSLGDNVRATMGYL